MKKRNLLIFLLLTSLLLTACSGRKNLDQLLERGNKLIKEGEYNKALEILNEAWEDGYRSKDGRLESMIKALKNYQDAQEKFEMGDYKAAEKSLELLDQKDIDLIAASQIRQLKDRIEAKLIGENWETDSGEDPSEKPVEEAREKEAKKEVKAASLERLESEISPYLKIFKMDEEELIENYGQPLEELEWIDKDSGQSEIALEYRVGDRKLKFTNLGGQYPYLEIE